MEQREIHNSLATSVRGSDVPVAPRSSGSTSSRRGGTSETTVDGFLDLESGRWGEANFVEGNQGATGLIQHLGWVDPSSKNENVVRQMTMTTVILNWCGEGAAREIHHRAWCFVYKREGSGDVLLIKPSPCTSERFEG